MVLNSIRNEHSNFSVYVAHIINEIRENSSVSQWQYIPSNMNELPLTNATIFSNFIYYMCYINTKEMKFEKIVALVNGNTFHLT